MASFANVGGGNGSDGDGNEERGRADGSRRAGQEVAAVPLPSLAHLAAAAAVAAGETPESIAEKDFPVGALAADLVAQRLALFGRSRFGTGAFWNRQACRVQGAPK